MEIAAESGTRLPTVTPAVFALGAFFFITKVILAERVTLTSGTIQKMNRSADSSTVTQADLVSLEQLMQEADEAFNSNDFTHAKLKYQQVIALEIECADANYAKGRLWDIEEIESR